MDFEPTPEIDATDVQAAIIETAAVSDAGSDRRAESSRAAQSSEAETTLATHGQRRINLIWERTQAVIAIAVVLTALLDTTILVLFVAVVEVNGAASVPPTIIALAVSAFTLLSTIVGVVTGFYFSRTNHEKIGGVPASTVGTANDEDQSQARR